MNQTGIQPQMKWLIAATIFFAGTLGIATAYDPSQSTGTGTHQAEGAELSTPPGIGTDSKSGRNEESGSAVGAEREASKFGRGAGETHGSKRGGSTGTGDKSGRPLSESGAGTTKGAAKSNDR